MTDQLKSVTILTKEVSDTELKQDVLSQASDQIVSNQYIIQTLKTRSGESSNLLNDNNAADIRQKIIEASSGNKNRKFKEIDHSRNNTAISSVAKN